MTASQADAATSFTFFNQPHTVLAAVLIPDHAPPMMLASASKTGAATNSTIAPIVLPTELITSFSNRTAGFSIRLVAASRIAPSTSANASHDAASPFNTPAMRPNASLNVETRSPATSMMLTPPKRDGSQSSIAL